MISTLKNAWRIPEIRKKIIFTLLMLVVFRLGSSIPVPYMDKRIIADIFEKSQGGILQFLDMMGGGTFSNFSVFATNIYPYITASIVIQLLAIAIPALEELSKQGEEGKKKMTRYTRYGAIALALIQAYGYTFGLFSSALQTSNLLQKVIVIISMVAGTAFLMWLGDMITEKGIGNGISLIIFIGIISKLPNDLIGRFALLKIGQLKIVTEILYGLIILIIIALVVALQEGERKIPVQYAKRVVGINGRSNACNLCFIITSISTNISFIC